MIIARTAIAAALALNGATVWAQAPGFEGVWEPAFNPAAMRGARPAPPVLTPAYEAVFAATRAKIEAGQLDIGAMCSPPGLTYLLQNLGSMEIIDGPKPHLTILFEYQSQAQRVQMDGRPLPEEIDPTPNGYSIGRWEGDTLVVETKGISRFTYFDGNGTPHSDQLHVISRFRQADPETLEVSSIATDPEALAAPYTFTQRFSRVEDGYLIPFECENIRNPVNPDGSLGYTFKTDAEIEEDAALLD
jgi:hypothetical protein